MVAGLSACSNTQDVITESSEDAVKIVYIEDGVINTSGARSGDNGGTATLAFRDENSLKAFADDLAGMTAEERNEKLQSMGITNLHLAAEQADKELEVIGEEANSEEEFRQMYNKYVEKYNGILITNYIDKSDLTLYVPDGDEVKSYIANEKGQYVVAGNIIEKQADAALPESIKATSEAVINAQTAAAAETNLNSYVYSPKKHKRVSFTASRAYNTIHFYMKAEKKMWYGWKSDGNRKYIIEPYLNNIKYNPPVYPVYVSTSAVNANMGTATGTVTGTIYTWTDMTLDLDSNGNEVTGPDGFPKRSRDKSKTVTVNLPLTI